MNDRILRARLVATTPLHIGSGDGGIAVDLPLLRDAAGRLYLPGTQIAGRLRETATRLGPALGWRACSALTGASGPCGCPVCGAFGERGSERESTEGSASRIWCFDALAEESHCAAASLVRDGVGISRRTGASAAEAGALYDREWIPTGTAFALRVEIAHDGDGDGLPRGAAVDPGDPTAEEVLAVALSEWVAGRGRGRIGAGAARGGGAFRLVPPGTPDKAAPGVEFRRADLATADGVMAFLREADPRRRGEPETGWLEARLATVRPATPPAEAGPPDGRMGGFVEVGFELAFTGAMLVSDPAAALANALHFAPVLARPEGRDAVLPGSSLRGVLRAQVERIARTLGARQVATEQVDGARRARAMAMACPACDPFEAPGDGTAAPSLAACAAVRRGREEGGESPGDDCVGCALFGSTHQGSRLWVDDAPLEGEPTFLLRDFVAIDRFTGGARDGAKFDALPLYRPVFCVRLLLWDPAPWELGALALALRDVHDGLATLGAHGSRGFGEARVGAVTLTAGQLAGEPPLPADEPPAYGGLFRLGRWTGTPEALVTLARERGWVGAFHDACGAERRPWLAEAAVRDDYFGVEVGEGVTMEDLYPLVVEPHREEVEG